MPKNGTVTDIRLCVGAEIVAKVRSAGGAAAATAAAQSRPASRVITSSHIRGRVTTTPPRAPSTIGRKRSFDSLLSLAALRTRDASVVVTPDHVPVRPA
jgi:hypothetical protein